MERASKLCEVNGITIRTIQKKQENIVLLTKLSMNKNANNQY